MAKPPDIHPVPKPKADLGCSFIRNNSDLKDSEAGLGFKETFSSHTENVLYRNLKQTQAVHL